MMGEAQDEAGVSVVVLAGDAGDAAVATCAETIVGGPTDLAALRALADRCDVITFDHELVDLDQLRALQAEGVTVRPSPAALRFAVDKAYQRRELVAAQVPVPRFIVVGDDVADLGGFVDQIDAPPVVKTARGGYDGRGVAFPATKEEALALVGQWRGAGEVIVEERLTLQAEAAQLVVRDARGHLAPYPVVDTLQRSGMCVEVRYPSALDPELRREIDHLTSRLARLIQGVGVLAVEYFITGAGVMVNEVALRPHNTGHWTIEGTTSSQFVQHLRAVAGLDLGEVAPLAPCAVMVNVVGADTPSAPEAAQRIEGVAVHDYGKAWRPGRKLGHVTALGDDPEAVHVRAWAGARAYGTSTREA